MNIDTFVGQRIREKRQKLGLTLVQVADKLSISHQQLQKYEQAQSKVSLSILHDLSKIFGVQYGYFFDGFDIANNNPTSDKISDVIAPVRDKSLNLLLVEDDPGDELIMRKALASIDDIVINIFAVHNGDQAMNFLRHRQMNVSAPNNFVRPDIILLDMNIPKRTGPEIVREVKRDRDLQDIPVIIVTNSISVKDMVSLYRLYISGYICKSHNYNEFEQMIKTAIRYWAHAVVLPRTAGGAMNCKFPESVAS